MIRDYSHQKHLYAIAKTEARAATVRMLQMIVVAVGVCHAFAGEVAMGCLLWLAAYALDMSYPYKRIREATADRARWKKLFDDEPKP